MTFVASPSCAHGILLLPVQAGWGAVVQGEGRAHPACSHDGEDRTREGCASCSGNSRKWGQKQPRRAKTSWMDSRSLVNTMRVGGWRELCQGPQTSCLRMWPNPVHSPSRWLLVKHHQTPLLRSTTRDHTQWRPCGNRDLWSSDCRALLLQGSITSRGLWPPSQHHSAGEEAEKRCPVSM